MPIGGIPAPWRKAKFRPTTLYPFLPQQAWLDGSVLIVEYQHRVRQCDLRTASRIRIREITTFGWKMPFHVLEVCPTPSDEPVGLVLSGPDSWILLTAEHLRLLAQIVSSRQAEPGTGFQKLMRFVGGQEVKQLVRFLNHLADHQQFRPNGPVDWSFRSDPQGLNRPAADREADAS